VIACVGHESAASWTASLRIIEAVADVQPAVLVDAENVRRQPGAQSR